MSMAQVAKRAKVSPATVCRVLKHGNGVSDEKSRAVRKALRELGYQHAMRDRLSQQRDVPKLGSVMVLMSGRGEPIDMSVGLGHLLRGMEQVLAEERLQLALSWVEEVDRLPRLASDGLVQGVVIVAGPKGRVKERLLGVPAVSVLARCDGWAIGVDQVLPDDNRVGSMAAEYLLDAGCRRLALAHPEQGHPAFEIRGQAFLRTAAQAGAAVDSFTSVDREGTDFRAAWAALADRLLQTDPRPTGLFVPSDRHAGVLYTELQGRGVQLGTDLRVISCDNDQPHLMNLRPRPATIDLQTEVIGRVAAEWLLRRIRKPNDLPPVMSLIEPILVAPGKTVEFQENRNPLRQIGD